MSGQEGLAGVREGDVLAGKYRVDKVLGVGGMGVVVAAHHLQLDDRVAIKFLLPDTLGNKDAVARFAREARAAVKIKSEHVARVTDVGTLESGAPFMVMEYLEGGDLSGWVAQRGALPVEQAVDFLLQASEAIAEAHTLGIVHRDLKPANLFVARLPGGVQSVKVLDFGISKLTGLSASGGQSSATKTSALMGSPLYMSPEQMQSSKDVDVRGDIWALGVILYELVAGVSPFIADTMPELILKIMSSPPPPLRDHRPDAPDGLEAVILRCVEKDRGRRYQTVGELAFALLPYGSKRGRSSVDRIFQVMQAAGMSSSALALPPSSGETEPTAAAATAGTFGGTVPGGGRARPVALLVGASVLLLGVGVVVFMSGRASSNSPAATGLAPEIPAAASAPPAVAREPLAPVPDLPAEVPVAPAAAVGSASAPSAVAPTVVPSPHSGGARSAVAPRSAPPATPSSRPPKVEQRPSIAAAPISPPSEHLAAPPPPLPKKQSPASLIDDRR